MTRHTFIIAEAGVNHNGNPDLALQLVDHAAKAGADAVKFQTFNSALLASAQAGTATYQKRSGESDSQLKMLQKLELSQQDFLGLIEHCRKRKITFLSSAFDFPSLDFLNSVDMSIFKIPSGEITNLPYLEKIASFGKKVILSCGMSEMQEIKAALSVLTNGGVPLDEITLLQCTSAYPTPASEVNLLVMQTLRDTFGTAVGFSDHTKGINIPIASVALGATVIEKHFTLDTTMEGPDHAASLDPVELKNMVNGIREVEQALGSAQKTASDSEKETRMVARKSIVAATPISAGSVFSTENITVKRPGTGLSPMRWHDLLGTEATRDYAIDEMVEL